MKYLAKVIGALREFGPELKPIPGAIVKDKDAFGRVLMKPERAPATPPPGFNDATELAIRQVGMGSRESGLEFIFGHPLVRPEGQRRVLDDPRASFSLKNAAEIENRWFEAWKQIAGRKG
jgi:hypothetical protein